MTQVMHCCIITFINVYITFYTGLSYDSVDEWYYYWVVRATRSVQLRHTKGFVYPLPTNCISRDAIDLISFNYYCLSQRFTATRVSVANANTVILILFDGARRNKSTLPAHTVVIVRRFLNIMCTNNIIHSTSAKRRYGRYGYVFKTFCMQCPPDINEN